MNVGHLAELAIEVEATGNYFQEGSRDQTVTQLETGALRLLVNPVINEKSRASWSVRVVARPSRSFGVQPALVMAS